MNYLAVVLAIVVPTVVALEKMSFRAMIGPLGYGHLLVKRVSAKKRTTGKEGTGENDCLTNADSWVFLPYRIDFMPEGFESEKTDSWLAEGEGQWAVGCRSS